MKVWIREAGVGGRSARSSSRYSESSRRHWQEKIQPGDTNWGGEGSRDLQETEHYWRIQSLMFRMFRLLILYFVWIMKNKLHMFCIMNASTLVEVKVNILEKDQTKLLTQSHIWCNLCKKYWALTCISQLSPLDFSDKHSLTMVGKTMNI